MTGILRAALVLFVALSLLTGIAYPALVTAIGQACFPDQANGSLIRDGERVLGSRSIGQAFSGAGFFWGRPSATGPVPYNAAASSGSNLGPSNPALHTAVAARIAALRAAGSAGGPVPADLVTASGSGLDPHVSPAAASLQVSRVAAARGLSEEVVQRLVEAHTEGRSLGLLGEPRVHVLSLNLDLERIEGSRGRE